MEKISELCCVVIPSKAAHSGMTVGEVLLECLRWQLPGLPFCDDEGHIIGRVSLKHALAQHFIPTDVYKHAHLLGDLLDNLDISKDEIQAVMDIEIDPFVTPDIPTIVATSPLVKALALIEQFRTSYIFVVDDDGIYQGTITMLGIAQCVLQKTKITHHHG